MSSPQRQMHFVDEADFMGWICSDCRWVFKVPQHIDAATLDDLIFRAYQLRTKQFDAHICKDHMHTKEPKKK